MTKKVLLVIDLQKQFKDNNGKYEEIAEYCNTHTDDYDVILPTVFQNTSKSNFVKHLNYVECNELSEGDNIISPKNTEVEIKHGYASRMVEQICSKDDVIDIVGCDTDACIIATAYKLWDDGYNFHVLSKYVYTSNTEYNFTNDNIIEIMRRNFGDCVI